MFWESVVSGAAQSMTPHARRTNKEPIAQPTNKRTLMKQMISVLLLATACGIVPAVGALTPADEASLLFIKQEEKVARDVYRALYAKWGQSTFQNIAVSEQRHMDAADGLIARYRLHDTTPAESGEFTIPELQELHDQRVAASISAGLGGACSRVGGD
jgi:hypothetical protein